MLVHVDLSRGQTAQVVSTPCRGAGGGGWWYHLLRLGGWRLCCADLAWLARLGHLVTPY
jgi:hypothetical protein